MPTKSLAVEFDQKKIDAIFSNIDQCHKPGAAVGIAIDGKPIYRKGFGLANIELPIVLSPTIRMRIYSITKQFTCLAYMLLCEDGKAGLDDPIGKHVFGLNPASQNATMRQLMGHTSGIRDASGISWRFDGPGSSATSADIVSLYRSIDDTIAPAGTSWHYNDGGYLLLTAAIEHIAGESFEDVLRKRILDPIGMFDTMLHRRDTDCIPNLAAMHMTTMDGGYAKSSLGIMAGEGGIVSTVDDMLRWMNHIDAPVVGAVRTWEVMKAPQVLTNGTSTGYGLGLSIGKYRGADVLGHGGSGLGANSQMLKLPSAGLDIVVMANRHDVSSADLAMQIVDGCVTGLDPVKKNARGRSLSGTYTSSNTGRVIQLGVVEHAAPGWEEGQQIVSIDGMDIPMSNSDGTLHPIEHFRSSNISVTPVRKEGEVALLKLKEFGSEEEFIRQKPQSTTYAGTFAGRYAHAATGIEATIENTDMGPRLRTASRFGSVEFHLECLAAGYLRAKAKTSTLWGATLAFDADGTGFQYVSHRGVALRFRRCR